jgi:cell division septation protein DedD
MAKRRQSRKKNSSVSPVVSMLFGLAIGLSVAAAVYMKDRRPHPAAAQPQPASLQNALDDNGELAADGPAEPSTVATDSADAEREVKRFTFYDILPNFEVITREEEPVAAADATTPQAIVEPGVYVLQAGSFSTHNDADRRRAELALHGIESHIQRVKVNDRNYHRVYVGPIDDLDQLNMLRSRLRAAQIDVLRIRLSD